VARLGELFRQLENEGRRDLGCVDGSLTLYGRSQGKARVCFNSEIRFVDGDGTVTTDIEITGTLYDPDGKLGKYPHFRESLYTSLLPSRCANGMLEFSGSDTATNNGKKLEHKIHATCSSFESTYSSELTPVVFTAL
jgi:hypothetical protein